MFKLTCVVVLLIGVRAFGDEPKVTYHLVDGKVVEKRVSDLEKRVEALEKGATPAKPAETVLGWDYKKVCTEEGCKLVKVYQGQGAVPQTTLAPPQICPSSHCPPPAPRGPARRLFGRLRG